MAERPCSLTARSNQFRFCNVANLKVVPSYAATKNTERPVMADLTTNQLRLLRELDFYGGVLIIRTHTNDADYAVLEKDGLVTTFALNIREVRYKITWAGRAAIPN
jgi:hypothetical protein